MSLLDNLPFLLGMEGAHPVVNLTPQELRAEYARRMINGEHGPMPMLHAGGQIPTVGGHHPLPAPVQPMAAAAADDTPRSYPYPY
jgi:hypothetical protein